MWAQSLLKKFSPNCVVTLPKRECPARSFEWVVAVEEAGRAVCALSPCAYQLLSCSSPSPGSCPCVRVLCKRREKKESKKSSPVCHCNSFTGIKCTKCFPASSYRPEVSLTESKAAFFPQLIINMKPYMNVCIKCVLKMLFPSLVSLLFCTPAFHSKE